MIAIKWVNILWFYEIIFQFILLCRKIQLLFTFFTFALAQGENLKKVAARTRDENEKN